MSSSYEITGRSIKVTPWVLSWGKSMFQEPSNKLLWLQADIWPQIVDSWTILWVFQTYLTRHTNQYIADQYQYQYWFSSSSNMGLQSVSRTNFDWNHLPHKPLFSVQVIFFTCIFLTKNLKVFRFVDHTIREYPTSVSTVCSLLIVILFWGF